MHSTDPLKECTGRAPPLPPALWSCSARSPCAPPPPAGPPLPGRMPICGRRRAASRHRLNQDEQQGFTSGIHSRSEPYIYVLVPARCAGGPRPPPSPCWRAPPARCRSSPLPAWPRISPSPCAAPTPAAKRERQHEQPHKHQHEQHHEYEHEHRQHLLAQRLLRRRPPPLLLLLLHRRRRRVAARLPLQRDMSIEAVRRGTWQ